MFFEEVKRTEGSHDEKKHDRRPPTGSHDEKKHACRPPTGSHDEKKHARRPPISNRSGVFAVGWGSSMIASYLLVLRKAAPLVETCR